MCRANLDIKQMFYSSVCHKIIKLLHNQKLNSNCDRYLLSLFLTFHCFLINDTLHIRFICLLFFRVSIILHPYGDVTIADKKLQI